MSFLPRHGFLFLYFFIGVLIWSALPVGQVGRIKQKRGYKDQWPYNIKIYTDDKGKNKGDACLAYEDPSAAHSAGGFFNSMYHGIAVLFIELFKQFHYDGGLFCRL